MQMFVIKKERFFISQVGFAKPFFFIIEIDVIAYSFNVRMS